MRRWGLVRSAQSYPGGAGGEQSPDMAFKVVVTKSARAKRTRQMNEAHFMLLALRLARRGRGTTSPNPMVGAVLVKRGKIIGRGWHHRAGGPHAEIEALRDALGRGNDPQSSTQYVTLEPCSTHGRT